jgi:hypothetical protein
MAVLQDWLLGQVGKTWRILPAVRIDSRKTAEQHAAGNIYFDAAEQLRAQTPRIDESGERVDFCNWRRLYVLYATGYPKLENMSGRQPFGCPPAPENPMEPYGPGVAGGPSGWAIELIAGRVSEDDCREQVAPPSQPLGTVRGATLHEMLHCLGVQHPTEAEHGPESWLSPMAGYWHFGLPECRLLPHEVAYLRESHFFS